MYEIERCPVCGKDRYLCWNCGKCPDCIDHKGEFSRTDITQNNRCILCGNEVFRLEGCVFKYKGVYQVYTDDESMLTYYACIDCTKRPNSGERLKEKVENVPESEREKYYRVMLFFD